MYDREGQQLNEKLGRLKRQFDDQVARAKPKDIEDYLVQWKRFAVLSYPSTLVKLTGAATGRMITSPVEEMIGSGVSKVLPRLASRAPTEGRGGLRTEITTIRKMWESEPFRAMWKKMTTGASDIDILYGGKTDAEFNGRGGSTYNKVMEFPGHAHGALKEIPRRTAFFRAFEKRLQFAAREGRDITDPGVQMAQAMEAYNDANRAILMQPNALSNAFNGAMRSLESQGSRGARVAAAVGRFEIPITRVPVNFVAEGLNYTAGAPYAAMKTAYLHAFKDGFKSLTPQQADSLMRSYKKGSLGLAVLTLGFMRPDMFGGYYQPGEKRDPNDVQAGGMKLFGYKMPRALGHIPILEAAQVGATFRRVYDKMAAKGEGFAASTREGAIESGLGIADEIPFMTTPGRLYEQIKSGPEGRARLVGDQFRSMIPGPVQQAAQYLDRDSSGDVIKRQATTAFEQFKTGIPLARQAVPPKKKERTKIKF